MQKHTGSTVLIGSSGMLKLERIKLGSGTYDERWLEVTVSREQALVHSQALAVLAGGKVAMHDGIYVSPNGTSAPLPSSLLPNRAGGRVPAIDQLILTVRATPRSATA